MRIKKDYPIPYIETLLQNYDSLSAGLWFETEDGKRVKPSSNRAPFEAAIIAKTDIDMAIDSLSPDEQDVIKRMYFEEKGLDPDSMRIVKRAIRNMGNYLNGECILRRWAWENHLLNTQKRLVLPDGFNPEVDQYIIDICEEYCVLEGCVEK